MSQWNKEDLESLESQRITEDQQQETPPKTPAQRALAWIALAVVLFGLAGTIYWMVTFVP